jgi:hemerythrin
MSKPLFDFQSEFLLGIEEIDAEHRTLVDLLNETHVLISAGDRPAARQRFVETLSAYVNEHFAHEEAFMQRIGFPGLEDHRKIHENFKASFSELKPLIETYDDEAFRKALGDAFAWIVTHIGKTDRRYARFYLEGRSS